jgi:virulence factor Mce-like protein
MELRSRSAIRLTSRLAPAALVVAVVALVVVLSSGGGTGHRVTVLAPSATWMMPGLEVRVAGRVVGSVTAAAPTKAGTARLELSIDDSRAWPLPAGTKAQIRWAGTIGFTNRYVELDPGKPSRSWVPDGGVISGRDVVPSVELDQLTGLFNAGTRAELKTMLDNAGPALAAAQAGLSGSLDSAPAALQQARAVLQELGAAPGELSTLVSSADSVVHAAQSSNPGVGQLVSGAATTLSATAAQADALGRMLAEMPGTLDSANGTLRHADTTLGSANSLLQALSPGVSQVRRLAAPLNNLLGTVVAVGPDAYYTLASVRRAVPDLNPLLDRARTLMPQIESVGRQGATELACIRPYAPEAAGLASTWVDFLQYGDKTDKYARVNGGAYPYLASETPVTTAQIVKLFPGLKYVFPAPPGQAAGQPWLIPSCGVGPDALDPSKDPEAP